MSLWTPDANRQALEVSRAIAEAREEGRRQERGRLRARVAKAVRRIEREAEELPDTALLDPLNDALHRLLDMFGEPPAIEPDSPADPGKTWTHRDSGE